MKLVLAAILALLAASAPTQYFTSTDGYRIAYTVEGSGPPMLVIPGGPGLDSAYTRDAVKGLHARAYLMDLRGTGASHVPETPSEITVAKILADMDTLRRSVHAGRWIVMGHSFGGYLAQAYASRYSGSVRALILVSSSAPDLKLEGQVQQQMAAQLSPRDRAKIASLGGLYRRNPDAAMQQQMDTLLPYFMADRRNWPKIKPLMDPPHNSYAMSRALYADLASHYEAGSLHMLHVPVLAIYGEKDGGVDLFSQAIRANTNGARIAVVAGAGHFIWLEQPEVYRATINRFLRMVPRV